MNQIFILLAALPFCLSTFFGVELHFRQNRCFSQFLEVNQELSIQVNTEFEGLDLVIHKRFTKAGSLFQKTNLTKINYILTPNVTDYFQICVKNLQQQNILVWIKLESDLHHQSPFDAIDNESLSTVNQAIEEISYQLLRIEVFNYHVVQKIKEQDLKKDNLRIYTNGNEFSQFNCVWSSLNDKLLDDQEKIKTEKRYLSNR